METRPLDSLAAGLLLHRRSFPKMLAAAATLSACGGSDDASGNGTVVSGQIDEALLFPVLVVGSGRGPSAVKGNTFTTTISDEGVVILVLKDGTARGRAFTLTFHGEWACAS